MSTESNAEIETQVQERPLDDAVLHVDQLEVVYNHVQLAVQGLTLQVQPGEIIAVLGTNGAGKTTTLRAISGFLPGDDASITDGDVIYRGTNITGTVPHRLAKGGIALVPERDKIFNTLTVQENLDIVPTGSGRSASGPRTRELIEELFPVLPERATQVAGYLSGGERQMLGIAKAMLLEPDVLLVDELSFGLAPKITATLMDTLRILNREGGVSIILVEQNAEAALSVADYAYVVENGSIVYDGTPDDLRKHEDVQEFYLGSGSAGFSDLKQYKRRRRWWG